MSLKRLTSTVVMRAAGAVDSLAEVCAKNGMWWDRGGSHGRKGLLVEVGEAVVCGRENFDSLRRVVMVAPPPKAPTAISAHRRCTDVSGPQLVMIEIACSHGMTDTTAWNHLYSLKC